VPPFVVVPAVVVAFDHVVAAGGPDAVAPWVVAGLVADFDRDLDAAAVDADEVLIAVVGLFASGELVAAVRMAVGS